LAKQVVYLAPGIFAKLDADPAMRQAVLARMGAVTLSWRSRPASPVRADLQRACQIIAESGFSGLFEALKCGGALPAVAFAPLVELLQQQEASRQGE
jgi:hypothetical protein